MDSRAVRTIVILGVVGTFMLTLMMMFTLSEVADTETPQIAHDVATEFAASLDAAEGGAVKLTMSRDGKGVDARRVYKLRLRPTAEVAADAPALKALMYHSAEFCAGLIGDPRGDVAIRCVAEIPGGEPKETIFVRDRTGAATQIIREVAELPPVGDAPAGGDGASRR